MVGTEEYKKHLMSKTGVCIKHYDLIKLEKDIYHSYGLQKSMIKHQSSGLSNISYPNNKRKRTLWKVLSFALIVVAICVLSVLLSIITNGRAMIFSPLLGVSSLYVFLVIEDKIESKYPTI